MEQHGLATFGSQGQAGLRPFDGLRAADDQNGMALPAAGQWPDWRRYFGGNKSRGAPLSICVWPQSEVDTKRVFLGKDIVVGPLPYVIWNTS